MVTNHWVNSSFDNFSWTTGTSLPNRDIVIPAGATLKRFVVSGTHMLGSTNGVNLAAVGTFYIQQTVSITTAPYAGHILFQRQEIIPFELVGLYDPVSGGRIYSQLFAGADMFFGINERTAFGKRSGAAFTVRYASFIGGGIGWTGLMSNSSATANFRCMYETSP